MSAPTIDAGLTLGELVAERPALAAAFERLQLDFCCGGNQTLAEACRARGLDRDTAATLLEQLADGPAAPERSSHDLRGATIEELCEHIVTVHHAGVREELPRITELVGTVVRVHGKDHPQLHDLQRLFDGLARDIPGHLSSEEEHLFPAALAPKGDVDAAALCALVAEHVADHAETGDALAALRELGGGYDTSGAYCNTHRRLLEALHGFEVDMHQHVHEENNILFPQLLARAGR